MAKESLWTERRKARENAYFHEDERQKIQALKLKRSEAQAFLAHTHDVIEKFERGFSPISGGHMFRAYIADDVVLDCPEEGVLTLPYDTLKKLLKAAENGDHDTLKKWQRFIDVALQNEEQRKNP